jgi:putative NADPH-quinone reductase
MRALVVPAHPLEESYCSALRDRTIAALEGAGHDVAVAPVHPGGTGPGLVDLAGVETLVLVYPTWWGSQPAPLLEWIQRVIGPWIDAIGHGESPLSSVEHLVAVTSHGSSRLINTVQGEPGRQLLERSLLPLCRSGADFRWIALYKLDRLEPADLTAFLDRVGDEVGALTSSAASS